MLLFLSNFYSSYEYSTSLKQLFVSSHRKLSPRTDIVLFIHDSDFYDENQRSFFCIFHPYEQYITIYGLFVTAYAFYNRLCLHIHHPSFHVPPFFLARISAFFSQLRLIKES